MTNSTPKDDSVSPNGDKLFDLLDGATGEIFETPDTYELQKKISGNKDYSIEERLEAYEDAIDSEVGDTTLIRARNIEREVQSGSQT